MSKLVLHLEDGTTMDIPLDQERITFGRRADNDVCLPNLAVSGEHAAVVTILDDSFLEDLGSTNGTLVNGNVIIKHFLRDRDELDIGRHKFIYYADEKDDGSAPYFARGMAPAAGDLGEQVQVARPIVGRAKRAAGGGRPLKIPGGGKDAAAAKPRAVKGTTAVDRTNTIDVEPDVPPPSPLSKPSVKVLAGPQAGRDIPLTKEETSIGRAGVQVALISHAGDAFRLKFVEGDLAPLINGQPATGDGVDLAPGDVIEIAGSRLEFVYRD
jgi:hypothetical protein